MKTHRINLNNNQLELLHSIHKFRFVTAPLLAEQRSVDKSVITRSLKVLKDRGYIDRKYDKSYKLLGKPARYYLAKRSINYLKQLYKDNDSELKGVELHYKTPHLGEPYIDYCLAIYKAYLSIEAKHPNIFHIFSRIETSSDKAFPKIPPALYLRRKELLEDEINEYLVDIFTDTPYWLIRKRIDQYIEHYEDGDWGEGDYPKILLVCPTQSIVDKATRYIEKAQDDAFLDEEEMVVEAVVELEI